MANLADVEQRRVTSRRRGSKNRDTLLPRSRETRAPGIEVNAPIVSPNQSKARILKDLLTTGTRAGDAVVGYIDEKAAQKRSDDRAAAANDAAIGAPNEEQMENSRAYAKAYHETSAAKTAAEMRATAATRVEALLSDDENPATVEDIYAEVQKVYGEYTLDEDGNIKDFGTPGALGIMGTAASSFTAEIMPKAMARIKQQTDKKLIRNSVDVLFDTLEGPPEQGYTPIKKIDPDTAYVMETKPVTAPGRIETTGRLPLQGTITSDYAAHQKRGSVGLDIDGVKGDPIEAPASGKVIRAGYDKRSGNYIILSHGKDANGKEITSSYSHLDARNVKVGDTVAPGSQIGTVGNTGNVKKANGGDGSHLHYRVKLDGEDVDPAAFSFDGEAVTPTPAGTGEPITWATAKDPGAGRVIDFEVFMKSLPPTVDKAFAKKEAMSYLINKADQEGHPEWLESVSLSVREDGTPSFTPQEQLTLRENADSIRSKKRRQEKQAQQDLFDENSDRLYTQIVNGEAPPLSNVRQAVNDGALDPRVGNWYVGYLEREQDRADAKFEKAEKEAQARHDALKDAQTASMAAALMVGGGSDFDPYEMFVNGDLGVDEYGEPSGQALSRMNALITARNKGDAFIKENPEAANYAAQLKSDFHPRKTSASGDPLDNLGMFAGQQSGKPLSPGDYAATMAIFERGIRERKGPEAAYREAKEYAAKHTLSSTSPSDMSDKDIDAMIAEMEARR